ncbi:MAG: GNAT family N-acetyltransferase [Thermomicrobiales bacterium]
MPIELVPVRLEDRPVLANLMQLYLYDFSEFAGWTINEHGLYDYRYLDHYWTDPGRHPFFVRADGELAGFALVSTVEAVTTDAPEHHMAEFFIMRKFRRTGVGETAARTLFGQFPGPWSVSQMQWNDAAQRFWRTVIARYTQGAYTERHDERGRLIQEFVSEGAPPASGTA